MCLIAFAYKVHPQFPLVLIANRDEFYERPTREAGFWIDEGFSEIVAGKDLKAGGTWMGINKNGKWGALTNYRDIKNIRPTAPSRGDLVMNYLTGENTPKGYLESVQKEDKDYNGFNLLVGDWEELFHYDNVEKKITAVSPGIHGVSNAVLNTPWPKLEHVKSELEKAIVENSIGKENLFIILSDEKQAKDKDLPETGLTLALERAMSSVFIRTERYGTRCASLLFLGREGTISLTERRFEPVTKKIIGEQTFTF